VIDLLPLSRIDLGKVSRSVRFEDLDEGFLGDVDGSDGFHPFFAFFLFFEEFAFAADVAAVALGSDVFAQGTD